MKTGITAHPSDIRAAAAAGYDFVELNVNDIRSMDEQTYFTMMDDLRDSGIRAEVLSGILPDDVRIIGQNVNASEIGRAMEGTLELARILRSNTLIFDCPALRCVPRGTDTAEAWRQMGNLIRRFQGWAAAENITIALMPMRRSVCGLIRHLSEAAMIPSLLGLDRVGIAASLYNMSMEAESSYELRNIRSLLKYIRISDTVTNAPPSANDGSDYEGLFDLLRKIGYNESICAEGDLTDFAVQAAAARNVLKRL